jgi:hypothetical protein
MFRFFLVLSERNKLREIGKFLVGYLLQKKKKREQVDVGRWYRE